MKELEDKKKVLAEIRQFHKPLNKEELIEHEKQYIENMKKRVVERQKHLQEYDWKPPSFEEGIWRKKIEEDEN